MPLRRKALRVKDGRILQERTNPKILNRKQEETSIPVQKTGNEHEPDATQTLSTSDGHVMLCMLERSCRLENGSTPPS